jgi:hypothetical protein
MLFALFESAPLDAEGKINVQANFQSGNRWLGSLCVVIFIFPWEKRETTKASHDTQLPPLALMHHLYVVKA